MDEFDLSGDVEEFDFSDVENLDGEEIDQDLSLDLDGSQVELFEVSGDGGNVASYSGSLGDVSVDVWNEGSSVSGTIEALIP